MRRSRYQTADAMTEDFLHFIWQHRYFDHQDLRTADGRSLTIIFPGFHNRDAGPDFFQSRIRLDDLEWVGGIEIHLRASDFFLHGHQHDHAYGAIILHVVWTWDKDVFLMDGSIAPVLILKGRISQDLLNRYGSLINGRTTILCSDQFTQVPLPSVHAMMEQASSRRLDQKASEVLVLARQCSMNWPEVTYRLTARAFGLNVNAIPFLRLAQLIPFKILMRIRSDLFRTEAMLFGMAGFLEGEPLDGWQQNLKTEFKHLVNTFNLRNPMDVSEWKFLRMRPGNFPTIRLAQFAAFVHQMISWGDAQEMVRVVTALCPSAYWTTHYLFGKETAARDVVPGRGFADLLLINVWVPVMLARATYLNQPELKAQAIRMLNSLSPEQNAITRLFREAGIKPTNAFETQGLVYQFRNYCFNKRCLDCELGMDLLGRSQKRPLLESF